MRRTFVVLFILVALVATACGQKATPTSAPDVTEAPKAVEPTKVPDPAQSGETISVAGSTTVQPLAEKLAAAFNTTNPNVKIDVAGGGSSAGVKAAGDGTADIGMASREIKQSELDTYPQMKIFVIARDGIAIVAHPQVPVDALTIEQVRGIFAGDITNWSEVGGDNQPIAVISREEGSGTRGAFEEMVMGEVKITDKAIFQDSNGKVRTAVASTPYAIAYLSFGYLDNTVSPIDVNGVTPTEANAANGTYPIVRPLNMVTLDEPTGVAKTWLDWILGPDGQEIVKAQGYISILSSGEEEAAASTEALSGQISAAGSTTVQPLAEKLAAAFNTINPNVKIDVAGGGSSAGVKAAGDSTADIGMASREIKQSELDTYPQMKIFVIARDGIAIVAHPQVPVDELTIEQVRGIFAGDITNWSEVGGDNQPIAVISREEGSGTRGAFEEMVMGEVKITDKAIFQDSNGKVRTAVASTPYSIAYLSFGYLDNTVSPIDVNGVTPTEANAANGIYPIVRPLNMVTLGDPSGLVKAWLDWILGPEGQKVVKDQGYIPVTGEVAAPTEFKGRISAAGSTTVQPLAEKLAAVFNGTYPNVKIDVAGGGSSAGVKAAGDSTADIGMASREIKQSELDTYPQMKIFVIARDGIAIVAHPEVPVDDLTVEQVRDIFAGKITNWSEVGGDNQPIAVISREEGSGTRGAFEEMVMGEEKITDKAIFQDSNGKVRTAVASTPYAIAYLSFGYLDNTVSPIDVNGVTPTEANAADGTYPIVRPLNMVTLGEPSGLVKMWLDWILGAEGQKVVKDQGYIPVQ